jgi:ribonucleotide monophosphatase NagD (HAD superfamily)
VHTYIPTVGFNLSDFDNIITSGDISHSLLQNNANLLGCQNWNILTNLIEQRKQKVYVFGSGDEDELYCTSAGWTLSSIDDANLIIARGTFTINDGTKDNVISKTGDFETDKAGYWKVMEESLTIAAAKKLPMLVCNPDKVRPDEGLPPMPGAIGDTYERFIWTTHCQDGMTEEMARTYVKRVGKPFRDVYDIALGTATDVPGNNNDRSRAIMIGDALETDVVGGCCTAGIDVLWVVNDGIHGKDVKESGGAETVLSNFNSNAYDTYAYGEKVMPRYITDYFRW